ncbi:metallophosphoesterase family protein [Haloarcula litorea]|uniref:metallophosphoesterase family protein n=1 Tax=Haloarcula litorea TaxID=3032579 RepID=UPI0023E7F486|nr:metallophosphoesterase family protein [Halomicroarcula sp. GDY20]
MTRFLASDLHLGHENIIEYCSRPFDSVEEMNQTLIENWNQEVRSNDDVVFFLGDLGFFAEEDQLRNWLKQLNGRVVFIQGNHDDPGRYVSDLNTHQYYTLSQGDQEYLLTHRPENAPRFWDDWIIHGHHHNNHPEQYPFINPEEQLANVSVELTDYRPVKVDYVLNSIEQDEWMDQIEARE